MKFRKLLERESARVGLPNIPGIENSPTGRLLIQMGIVLFALRVPVTFLLMMVISAVPVLAQGGSHGPIFNGNSSNLANIVREGLKLFAVLLFCAGGVFAGWMIINIGRKNEWTNQLLGAIGCFAFGTIVAVLWSIANGRAVDIGTDF